MSVNTVFSVPAVVSKISSGFILTLIDELEEKLHIRIDDIRILYLDAICNDDVLFDNNNVLIGVYSFRFTVHTNDVISEIYFDHVSVRDGWITETNGTDIVYLFFANLYGDDYLYIGCLTKRVTDEVYGGNIEETYMNILRWY